MATGSREDIKVNQRVGVFFHHDFGSSEIVYILTFHLMHNRPESRMRVGIMVYDLAGRQLWKHEESGTSGLFENYTVSWDLTSGGARMRPGVYIYRAAISTDNSKDATKARKFIILGE